MPNCGAKIRANDPAVTIAHDERGPVRPRTTQQVVMDPDTLSIEVHEFLECVGPRGHEDTGAPPHHQSAHAVWPIGSELADDELAEHEKKRTAFAGALQKLNGGK